MDSNIKWDYLRVLRTRLQSSSNPREQEAFNLTEDELFRAVYYNAYLKHKGFRITAYGLQLFAPNFEHWPIRTTTDSYLTTKTLLGLGRTCKGPWYISYTNPHDKPIPDIITVFDHNDAFLLKLYDGDLHQFIKKN